MSKNKPKQPDDLQDFRAAAAKLTAEQRIRLLPEGYVIPLGVADGTSGAQKWGYRCKQCNTIALKFIGERFLDASGNEVDGVPHNVPIQSLPWTQDTDMSRVNRSSPSCPNCKMNLVLDGGYVRPRLVINLDTWERSRSAPKVRIPAPAGGEMVSTAWPTRTNVAEGIAPEMRERMAGLAAQHGLDSIKVE